MFPWGRTTYGAGVTTNTSADDLGRLRPGFGRTDDAISYFSARLTFQTDVSDVHSALESGVPEFVLIDTRAEVSWAQGRIPGAIHLPTRDIATRASSLFDRELPVVTYCWGPGCDGATRGALEFARLGYRVKEMIGGYEYWVREGFSIATNDGNSRRAIDPLTAPLAKPLGAAACGC